jgi:hypothetical protein
VHLSSHKISVVFTTASPSPSPISDPVLSEGLLYGGLAIIAIIAVLGAILYLRKNKKSGNAKEKNVSETNQVNKTGHSDKKN